MKGLIIKKGRDVFKAGIPDNGVSFMANILQHDSAFWTLGGVKIPEEIHITWNGGMLNVGDKIEVEFAEFDEITPPIGEESHQDMLKQMHRSHNDNRWNYKLEIYYRLKKILEEEHLLGKE